MLSNRRVGKVGFGLAPTRTILYVSANGYVALTTRTRYVSGNGFLLGNLCIWKREHVYRKRVSSILSVETSCKQDYSWRAYKSEKIFLALHSD